MEKTGQSEQREESNVLYKGDHSRFVDYSFGNVKTQSIEISGNFVINSIAVGNPVDGGTITIPTKVAVVIIQSTTYYTQISIKMPLKPEYGQTLTIVSTVDIPNLSLIEGSFGTKKPTAIVSDIPLRFIFAGQWFNI